MVLTEVDERMNHPMLQYSHLTQKQKEDFCSLFIAWE
jgi:hypothetical protein